MITPKSFTKGKLLDFLTGLDSKGSDYLTVYLTPTSFTHQMDEFGIETGLVREVTDFLNDEAVTKEKERYQTGAVLFWSRSDARYLVIPPFPINRSGVFKDRPNTESLRQLLEKERALGAILLTWGWYAIGVFKNDKLIDSKIGTGHIHHKHRKGGSSQKRFARRTEEQKKDFLRRVSGHIEEKLQHHELEQIFFGGNRLILKPLCDECHNLSLSQISPRLLNVRYADREALLGSLDEINKSIVLEIAP